MDAGLAGAAGDIRLQMDRGGKSSTGHGTGDIAVALISLSLSYCLQGGRDHHAAVVKNVDMVELGLYVTSPGRSRMWPLPAPARSLRARPSGVSLDNELGVSRLRCDHHVEETGLPPQALTAANYAAKRSRLGQNRTAAPLSLCMRKKARWSEVAPLRHVRALLCMRSPSPLEMDGPQRRNGGRRTRRENVSQNDSGPI
ncbi:hypothetical protein HPB51_016085 [Rhipicephalus microplus]|uniref:Uncharacterized protein n=1 Tax=Rhipicephalus microplus TaxID=6941 RepID=A0A9J6DIK4_RHIMP|nr:hypothetical protein HPB51_016085 [Rhipicephalus microplus]